jgi:predicted dehydrogenase
MALGCGLIGCGRMGMGLARVIRDRVAEARVTAVCDTYGPNLEACCEELGAAHVASVEELVGRGDVDAVIIASPNHVHCEQALAAAAAGKHVFCEKPMALSVADCDRMIQACESARVRLMVGQSMRLTPLGRQLQEVAASRDLGEPVFGWASTFFSGFRPREWGVWHVERERSGGLFFHMAIHKIDLFQALFGPARRVHYGGGRYGSQVVDFDDVGTLLIDFRSGATGVISAASVSPIEWNEVRLLFTQGFAQLDSPWTHLEFGTDADHVTRIAAEDVPGPDAFELELGSFARWVLRDEPPVLTAAEGRAAVAVAEAAEHAERTGSPAEVNLG